jgi:hypothetical protein
MEVADDRRPYMPVAKSADNLGNGASGFVSVNSDANQFGTGKSESLDLLDSGGDVRSVGIRHGLDGDRAPAADPDAAHINGDRRPSSNLCH